MRISPEAETGHRGRERPGAQQLLDPARPLPRRRHQAELPGADAHRRRRRRRDQAAVLQAGPDPGAAGDRDARRRAPRCTSTATARGTRTARTSRPGTSRSSPRRPTTTPKTVDLTLAPGERKLFTGDGRLRLQLRAALGTAGAAVRVGADRRAAWARARSPRRSARISRARTSRRCAGHRRRHRGRGRGHGRRDAADPPVHPRQPGVLHPRHDLDRRRRGDGRRLRLAAGDDRTTAMPAENCPPGPEPCRPPIGNQLRAAFVGSLPGLAIGLTAGSLMAKKAPTYGRVTLIQSAALGGMFAGALTQVTVKWKPYGASWEQSIARADDATDARNGHLWPRRRLATASCERRRPSRSCVFDRRASSISRRARSSASTSASPPGCSAPTCPISRSTARRCEARAADRRGGGRGRAGRAASAPACAVRRRACARRSPTTTRARSPPGRRCSAAASACSAASC